jgi:hypothetical protein
MLFEILTSILVRLNDTFANRFLIARASSAIFSPGLEDSFGRSVPRSLFLAASLFLNASPGYPKNYPGTERKPLFPDLIHGVSCPGLKELSHNRQQHAAHFRLDCEFNIHILGIGLIFEILIIRRFMSGTRSGNPHLEA